MAKLHLKQHLVQLDVDGSGNLSCDYFHAVMVELNATWTWQDSCMLIAASSNSGKRVPVEGFVDWLCDSLECSNLAVPTECAGAVPATETLDLHVVAVSGNFILKGPFEASLPLKQIIAAAAESLCCPETALQLSAGDRVFHVDDAATSLKDLGLDNSNDLTCLISVDRWLAFSCLKDYDIGRVIHPYSFGDRKVADHVKTGKRCMLDVKSNKLVQINTMVNTVFREKTILSSLEHPFITYFYTSFQDDSCLYMVFEFAPGGDLFKYLRARKYLSEEATQLYSGMLLLALEYLHSREIIFRNVKPENCLISESGYLKLLDFGFAKIVPRGSNTYTLCGTPEYMSPETLLNKGHSMPADWWSLGIIIYEMLVGQPPFADQDPMVIYRKICSARYTHASYTSDAARTLLNGLLRSNPANRLDAAGVRQASFFQGLDWALLLSRELASPMVPAEPNQDARDCYDDYPEMDDPEWNPEYTADGVDVFRDW